MALNDVIKDARLKRNLKQEKAAKSVGVTVQTYSKWENGKTEPKASQVADLSRILGISTSEICDGFKSEKLELIEFMRKVSEISKSVNDFDLKLAIWESIDNDHMFLENLRKYRHVPERQIPYDADDVIQQNYEKDIKNDPSLCDEDKEIEKHLRNKEDKLEFLIGLSPEQKEQQERFYTER